MAPRWECGTGAGAPGVVMQEYFIHLFFSTEHAPALREADASRERAPRALLDVCDGLVVRHLHAGVLTSSGPSVLRPRNPRLQIVSLRVHRSVDPSERCVQREEMRWGKTSETEERTPGAGVLRAAFLLLLSALLLSARDLVSLIRTPMSLEVPPRRRAATTRYRGTSLIRTPNPVGPYSSPMPRDLW